MAIDFSFLMPEGSSMNPGSQNMTPEQSKMMMLGLLSNAFTNIGNLGAGRPNESPIPGLLGMQTMFNNQNQRNSRAQKMQDVFKNSMVRDQVQTPGYSVGTNWAKSQDDAQFIADQNREINALNDMPASPCMGMGAETFGLNDYADLFPRALQESEAMIPEDKMTLGDPRFDMSRAAQGFMESGDPELMSSGLDMYVKTMPEALKPQLVTVYDEQGNPTQKWVRPGQADGVAIGRGEPKSGNKSSVGQLIAERDALPQEHPAREIYNQAIAKAATHAPAAQMNNYGSPVAGMANGQPVFWQPTKDGGAPLIVPGITPPPPKPTPPTGEENTAAGYLGRMRAAEQLIGGLSGGEPTVGTGIAGAMPFAGDYVQRKVMTEKQQKYKQASDDWIRAKLRKESGAVIADTEMQREYQTYFPQPGDEPGTIAQKAAARRQAEAQMIQSAGRAAPQQTEVGLSAAENAYIQNRRQSGATDSQIANELQQGAANKKPSTTFDLPPNAKQFDGKTMRDTKSGKQFKSVNGKWIEVK